MKVWPRKNVVPYTLGVGALTLATAIGVIIYWNSLPAGGGFWGLEDLQSGATWAANSEPQPLSLEVQSVNVDGDPGPERTTSTAAPKLSNSAPETDPDVILLSGEAPLGGDSTNNPGAPVT